MPVRSGSPVLLLMLLTACGGGGGGGSTAGGSTGGQATGPDLVSISASVTAATVAGGGLTQINLVVANPGNAAAANVTATVELGAGLTSVAVNCTAQNGAVCPASPATFATPSLPAGGSLRFSVGVSVAPGTRGSITSTASVSATGDMVMANNRAEVVINAYAANLRVTTSSSGGEFFSGGSATYTMTVSNLGPDAARDVTIQAVTSPGQTLSSIACVAVAVAASCPAAAGSVMTVPELPSGESLEFTVNASIDPTKYGAISGTLHVSELGDPDPSDNVATSSATARIPTSPQSPSFIALQSDAGATISQGRDFIGLGKSYYYDRSTAQIDFTVNGTFLTVRIMGDERWDGYFNLPNSQATLLPGNYPNLGRSSHYDPVVAGLSWGGEGRGCGTVIGSVIVDDVTYAAGALATLDLRFVQHCEGSVHALRGQIRWNAADGTRPPGPVNPPPIGLWEPPAGATPATVNYVYLQSDSNDWVGYGGLYTYTQANALLTPTVAANGLSFTVIGNENWYADFRAMSSLSELEPGYYGNLHGFPFHNTARGGLRWHGDGRTCNTLDGWFVVDSVTYSAGLLTSIDLRFEQQCTDGLGWDGKLRGKIHWVSGDPTQPPTGPQNPPPTGLWSPPAGATPATGNYVYLKSDVGDFIGAGQTLTYTHTDSLLSVSTTGARLNVSVTGDETWSGAFQAMSALAELEPGYYGNIGRFPFHNPVIGGQSWNGEGRSCNESTGWFVVDHIDLSGGVLAAIDLRFEQHCENRVPALRGQIHWALGDLAQPPGPQNPPPANLWSPSPGATPATGNYVYFSSTPGDPIGQGQTYLYTGADVTLDANVDMTFAGPRLTVFISGAESWIGQIVGMVMLQELEPGYYGNVQSYPGHNPVRGGLSWSGVGRGCSPATGWFVVDNLIHSNGVVESLDLRFEQSCYGQPPLRGAIHWIR